MKTISILFSMIIFFLMIGCATVKPPVIETIPDEEPVISATLMDASDHSLKRKVSIARFSNETMYGQGGLFNNNQNLGKQAMDILSTKLTKTGKFLLFERPDLELLTNGEDELGSYNIVSDYLIVGSISEFGRKNTSETGIFSRTKKQTAYAKVNVRLINIKTGQVIYAEEGSGEAYSEVGTVLGAGEKAGYDSTLNDKALDAAISKLVSNIVENLLNDPWRSYILEKDEQIIISGGKTQNISEGDIFAVKKRGKTVKNPQTGLDLELPGEEIARIKIVSFFGQTAIEEISFCELVEGDLSEYDITDLYVEEITEQEDK
ncbi:CsgG/HfaB family protein [Candidatus Cloacimonadota bacterium]